MTLSEMAEYVGSKVRQSDAAAIARCKSFLKQRYELIWNDGLWRASVFAHDFRIQPDVLVTTALPFGNQWCNGAGVQALPPTVDRVLALRRLDAGIVVEQIETLYRSGTDEFEQTGAPMKFVILPRACVDLTGQLTVAEIESHAVEVEHDVADDNLEIRVKCIDTEGTEQVEAVTLPNSQNGTMANFPLQILSATKPATEEEVRFVWGDNADLLFSIGAAETAAKRYPRIRLLPRPTADLACKVLVKKKATALDEDADAPELEGVENALMTFAQADMLQHARQYAKATAVQTEALALLEQFKRMEVVQQATRRQVTPDVDVQSGDWESDKGWYA